MAQDAAPPASPWRITHDQGAEVTGTLHITARLSHGTMPDEPDLTYLVVKVTPTDPAATTGLSANAHTEADADGLAVTLALDLSALDVLDAAVHDAYAAHRRHHDQQRQVTA